MKNRRHEFPMSIRIRAAICMSLLLLSTLRFSVRADDAQAVDKQSPVHESELIFQPLALHTHGSCVVECPNGDLLACWYQGSGERRADDVAVMGARRRRGDRQWSKPFLMADTPGFPDTNPCLLVDPRG